MILNGEADVLRDEGEAYARKLRLAGVDVTAIRLQAMTILSCCMSWIKPMLVEQPWMFLLLG